MELVIPTQNDLLLLMAKAKYILLLSKPRLESRSKTRENVL